MDEKLGLLSQLIHLIRVDGKESDIEHFFLGMMADILEVSKERLHALLNHPMPFFPPKLEAARIVQFQRLVLLANVDLKVQSEELRYLREAGLKLGLRSEAVHQVMAEMQQQDRGLIPEKRLLEIFRIYHN